jgi:hypothetical protein
LFHVKQIFVSRETGRFHSRRATGVSRKPSSVLMRWFHHFYWIVPVLVLHYEGVTACLLAVIVSVLVFTLQHVVDARQP